MFGDGARRVMIRPGERHKVIGEPRVRRQPLVFADLAPQKCFKILVAERDFAAFENQTGNQSAAEVARGF